MEKLPIEYENGFIGKIKNFFKNLFFKNQNLKVEYKEEKNVIDIPKSNVFDKMQKEHKKIENETFIVEQTVKNPELIKNLSDMQKEKLDELYDRKIEENNRIIKQNNKKISDLELRLNKIYDDKIKENDKIIAINNEKILNLKNQISNIQAS